MLAEFFRELHQAAQKALSPSIIKVEGVRDKVWMTDPKGNLSEVPVHPKPADVELRSMEDVSIALDHLGDVESDVYIDGDGVEVVLDSDRLEGSASFAFAVSEQYLFINSLCSPQRFSVKNLYKKLKVIFPEKKDLANQIKKIDWVRSTGGHSSVEHGKESLGKKVEAAVQQADKIPESFTVSYRPWTNVIARADLEIHLFLEADDESIELQVSSDAVTAAEGICLEQAYLKLRAIVDDKAPVIRGCINNVLTHED